MLWFPTKGRLRSESNVGSVGDTTPGTTVTTGTTFSNKGTPAELIAATAFDSFFIVIVASGYAISGFGSRGCLDILIGAATEAVLIPNLLMGYCGDWLGSGGVDSAPKCWAFPLYIPAGSRLATQAAGEVAR